MKHLTATDRKALAERLELMRREVLGELRQGGPEAEASDQGRGHDVQSHADAAEVERFDEVRFAEIEVDRNRLSDIDRALQHLAEGRYGVCVECGKDIPRERLLAQPIAIRCAACQSAVEHQGQH